MWAVDILPITLEIAAYRVGQRKGLTTFCAFQYFCHEPILTTTHDPTRNMRNPD
jgi:hypothetical protein